MSTIALVLTALVSVALLAGLLMGFRRRGVFLVSAALMAVLAAAWAVALVAVNTDYRDADGFVDCWPYCTALQQAVGVTLLYGPVVATLVALTTIVLYFLRARRRPGPGGGPGTRADRRG